MAENKEYLAKTDDSGKITISEDVVASISSIAASEIDGVGGLGASNVVELLGKKAPSKGVKVLFSEDSVELQVTISVKKGFVIPTVAKAVQENIISAVESMTGIRVASVNVKVANVTFEKAKKAEEPAQ